MFSSHKTLSIALIVSIAIHGSILVGIAWWSYQGDMGLGGGDGIVEVAIVGGTGNTGMSSFQAKQHNATPSPLTARAQNDNASLSPQEAEGAGEKETQNVEHSGEGIGREGGGVGMGIGGGSGYGDPRLLAIWDRINKSKYYPEIARRQRLEGAPKIAFSIAQDGKVGGVKVVESCGNDILDRAAVETIQRSQPLPFYPQQITIAVRYSLKDR